MGGKCSEDTKVYRQCKKTCGAYRQECKDKECTDQLPTEECVELKRKGKCERCQRTCGGCNRLTEVSDGRIAIDVLSHGTGHALGLLHGRGVMSGSWNWEPNWHLSTLDISKIQALYGKKKKTTQAV